MRHKRCQVCGKHPIAYVTRQNSEGKKLYVCELCAPKYYSWGIVARLANTPTRRSQIVLGAVK